MDTVKHLYGFVDHLRTLSGDGANALSMYYVSRCRQLLPDVESLKRYFGPSVMCSYCGSLWSKNEHRTKIAPGRGHSKSLKRTIEAARSGNKRLTKFQAALVKRSSRGPMNKIVIECSVCSRSTRIPCRKPERPAPTEEERPSALDSQRTRRRRRRRKDKTAGLNLSAASTPVVDASKEERPITSTPVATSVKSLGKSVGPGTSSVKKIRALNAVRLDRIMSVGKVKKSSSNLKSFLQELY